MNTKKLIVALSLCLLTAVALLVYENSPFASLRESDLYGSWLTHVPAAQQVEQALAQFGISYDIDDDLQMTYEFQYKEDGTVTVSVEKESAREIAAVEIEALRAGFPELLYAQYQTEHNMNREETDAMLASQGMTMESLVELSLSNFNFEEQFTSQSMTLTQYYCLKDGLLCYASTPVDLANGSYDMTVEPSMEGDTLILSNALDSEGVPFEGSGAVKYPLTLTRK